MISSKYYFTDKNVLQSFNECYLHIYYSPKIKSVLVKYCKIIVLLNLNSYMRRIPSELILGSPCIIFQVQLDEYQIPSHPHVPVYHKGWSKQGHMNINTLRPRKNGRHFADDIFKRIFLNENVCILLKISLKFISKGPINNIPAMVQIMACRRPGDKPLSEPMLVGSLTHICVTRPQWVNNVWILNITREVTPKSEYCCHFEQIQNEINHNMRGCDNILYNIHYHFRTSPCMQPIQYNNITYISYSWAVPWLHRGVFFRHYR